MVCGHFSFCGEKIKKVSCVRETVVEHLTLCSCDHSNRIYTDKSLSMHRVHFSGIAVCLFSQLCKPVPRDWLADPGMPLSASYVVS